MALRPGEIVSGWTDGLMFDASQKLVRLIGRMPPLLKLFVTWYAVRYPDAVPEFTAAAKRLGTGALPSDPVKFFEDFAPFELPPKALNNPPVC